MAPLTSQTLARAIFCPVFDRLPVRPDNLVPAPALKQALFLLLSSVLGKNRTFSSTNWENEHYFETLSALTLKIRNFE